LAGDSPAERIVRALLAQAVRRLHTLCATLLHRSYPRLTRPPLNLQAEELLGAVTERLLKAMREAHLETVRQFFALANQHMRWELNDLARRLDEEPAAVELREGLVPAPNSSGSELTPCGRRMLEAIEGLPQDGREAFCLVPEVPCLGGCPRWAVRRLCELRLKSWLAAIGRLRRPSLKEEWTYHSFLGYTREIGATLARGRRLAAGVPHFRPDVASR
jgi:RNA polymerase sigma-70 factor (ECF subfamily)